MIDRGKQSKTLSEVKLIENISENPRNFLEISPIPKKVPPSHKLQHHAHEQPNPFVSKEGNSSQRNCQNWVIQVCLTQSINVWGVHMQQNLNEDLKFVKLSFRNLCDSKLSGLHPFDNMAIIHWVKNRSKTER